MLNAVHAASVTAFRSMPRFRGRGTIARLVNRSLLKLGATPVVCTRMKAGHRMWLDARAQSMARAIYEGEYDAVNIASTLQFVRSGGSILDVGAQVGLWTLPLGIHARTIGARVHAFEPVPQNFRLLAKNIALNRLEAVVIAHDFALGDSDGEAKIAVAIDQSDPSAVTNAAIPDGNLLLTKYPTVQVKRRRFDAFWSAGRVDLVKLDIEGRETEFLAGAQKMIERHRPAILMEICRGFYRNRGLDLEALLPSLLPAYECHRITKSRIERCDLATIPELSDALLLHHDFRRP